MNKFFTFLAAVMTAMTLNASIEYPTGSGIYYDWDEDGIFYVNWVDGSATLGDVVIPDTVEIDGYKYVPMYFGEWTSAFWGNASITSLTINAPIPEITGWKFQSCTNMTSVRLTNGALTTIGEQAFSMCEALSQVEFAEGLTTIGQSAFWGDPIENVAIPASVETIDGYVFGSNTALQSATFYGVPQSVGENIFTWDDTYGYGYFFVCASYWNGKALKEVLDVNNGGLQYKVWDAQLDETWNNTYIFTCYTDELVVRRTLKANQWTPIVLPVWLTEAQLTSVFGEGVKLASFTGVDGANLTFDLVDLANGMNANVPYLIKVENDMTEFAIPYVWMSDNYDGLIVAGDGGTFVGSLNGYENYIPEGYLYINADGQLTLSDGTATVAAMDGYFTADDAASVTNIVVNGEVNVLRGDVNMDNNISIADVTALIDYLLSGDATSISIENANCNQDEGISIADVTSLIDYLLSGNW